MAKSKSKVAARDGGVVASRRKFLREAGAGATALTMPFFFVRNAVAADKELKIVLWSHFVPSYDTWYDQFVKEWGAANGVNATVDHIPHLELPARLAAEISAKAGHDLLGLFSLGPHLYRDNVVDLKKLVLDTEKKYGKAGAIGRNLCYDTETRKWPAFPDFYISFPGLYRKDLWDEIGMKPDTWDELRRGGMKLKEKGHPVGIGLSHSQDPNVSWRSVLWSFGATVQDPTGKHVTINSKQTLEAIKYAAALYKDAMTSEVLSWDDASNNRYLQSGRACWIHNPISAYRSTQKTNEKLADNIFIWKTPAGPVRRICAAQTQCYIVWKFSRNQGAAEAFLSHLAAHYTEAFSASTGYNNPMIPGMVPQPMPILSNDPTSHPSDKLQVLQTAIEWNNTFGYPGPDTPQIDEAAINFIIVDMMANVATGKMTAEESMKRAEKEIKSIFAKWEKRA